MLFAGVSKELANRLGVQATAEFGGFVGDLLGHIGSFLSGGIAVAVNCTGNQRLLQ